MSYKKHLMLFLYILVFIVLLVPTSFLAIEPDPPKLSNVTKRNTPLYLSYYDINGKLIRSIDKRKKMVAITYDDGPSVNTKKILETLNKYNSVATFFVIGNRVEEYSDPIKTAYNYGCEIGNHTFDHKLLTDLGSSEIQYQIEATNTAVQNCIGVNPVIMRPPCGLNDCWTDKNINMPLILWSIDTLDWKTLNPSSTIDAVLGKVKDGDIILMHDFYKETAIATETIVPSLVLEGYQLVTISELAECRGITLENQELYMNFALE